MELIDYTEKSLVLYGELTKNLVSELKGIGGLYNPKLTHPITKEKIAGWVFSKKHSEKVKEFLIFCSSKTEILGNGAAINEAASNRASNEDDPTQSSVPSVPSVPSMPEMTQVSGFTMIVPKIGNQVKITDLQGNIHLFEIIEVKPNYDGYIFDFKAKKENMIFDFVMVGKEWRIIKTNKPYEMNFV
jgi:hypothetical protein